MSGVNRPRLFLLAILVYLVLDHSLPAMPGAFVFEPADSVEGIQIARSRPAAEVAVLPSLVGVPRVVSEPKTDLGLRRPSTTQAAVHRCPAVKYLARAMCDLARPSEDPH